VNVRPGAAGSAAGADAAAASAAAAGAAAVKVRVRYLSAVREQAGTRLDEIALPAGSTLQAAADWIRTHRGLEVPAPALMSVLNGRGWSQLPAGLATVLADGDEIALFPLLSGG
jgi:molybdopterin converting factor small subunit